MPVDLTSFFEDFRGRVQFGGGGDELFLWHGIHMTAALDDAVDGLDGHVGAESHQSVIDILHVGIVGDVERPLHDDAARVDVVVEEEGGDTCLTLAIDDCPVDGRGSAILRQQGGVDVERAETGHGPHHFGQHTESHHHLQVGVVGAQLADKRRVLHLFGLQHGQTVLQRVFLYFRWLQYTAMASHGLIGLGDNGHHIVSALYEPLQGADGKFGRTHEYDA